MSLLQSPDLAPAIQDGLMRLSFSPQIAGAGFALLGGDELPRACAPRTSTDRIGVWPSDRVGWAAGPRPPYVPAQVHARYAVTLTEASTFGRTRRRRRGTSLFAGIVPQGVLAVALGQ